jgi:hypothetical protein
MSILPCVHYRLIICDKIMNIYEHKCKITHRKLLMNLYIFQRGLPIEIINKGTIIDEKKRNKSVGLAI